MFNFYLGNFINRDSFIHKLDPRIKILYVLFLSLILFSLKNYFEIFVFSIFVLLLIFVSKIKFIYVLKNLKRFFGIFLFIFLMYVVFSNSKIVEGLIVLWRFLMLIVISLVLTYSTSLSDLTFAIEKLSKPFKVFGVKPRNIAVMMAIAMRFMPVMFLRVQRLRDAMISRSADFKNLKSIKIFVISLLEKLFKSASTLSDAMMARSYDENVNSSRLISFKKQDYISMFLFLCFLGLVLII